MPENDKAISAEVPGAQPEQIEQPLNPYLSHKAQLFSVLASYLIARLYLYMWFEGMFYGSRSVPWLHSASYPAFSIAFLLWGEMIFRLRERGGAPQLSQTARRESVFWALCTVVVSLAIAFSRCNATSGWEFLFWHGFAAYWVLCRSGLLAKRRTSAFFAWDALNAILILPFSEFFLRIRTLWAAVRSAFAHRKEHRLDVKQAGITLLCVLVAIPIFALAINLLSEADQGFGTMLQSFRFDFTLPYQVRDELVTWMWSLPVGAYLYGLIGGAARKSAPSEGITSLEQDIEHLRFAPAQAGTLVTAAFCALYAFFFAVQAGYLFGAFFGKLPAGFSASTYAREGFYQLCNIMLLNFALLTVCAKLTAVPVRRSRALKAFSIVLTVMCLLFAVTAFSKIVLYIVLMGFTARRLLSSWAVLVFAAASVLACSTLIRPHKAIEKFIWFAAATFTILCVCY